MKAIIVNQAVPGTTEAFRQIKERRPDIICIAGESHEDLPEIGSAADLVTNNDFVLMQVANGNAKKVNTQVLAAYLGGLVGTFIATAPTTDINKLFTGETISNLSALITIDGLQTFLAKVNEIIQNTLTGMATAQGVTDALALKADIDDVNTALSQLETSLTEAINEATSGFITEEDLAEYMEEHGSETTHVVLTEQAYADLVNKDPDTIYMTYEQ